MGDELFERIGIHSCGDHRELEASCIPVENPAKVFRKIWMAAAIGKLNGLTLKFLDDRTTRHDRDFALEQYARGNGYDNFKYNDWSYRGGQLFHTKKPTGSTAGPLPS